MSYVITGAERREVNFQPENMIEEVLQNIWFLLNTTEYDCPLDRALGLTAGFTDRPVETAEALSMADIFDRIEQYEPRAEVLEVTFESNPVNGSVYARVEVDINGDDEEDADIE